MTPLVIMVAPNGARRTKADQPRLPITPAEIADEAARCAEAGASVLHVHVRSDDGRHTLDAELYRAAIDAVRQRLGERMVIQVTTEAVGRDGPAEQMAMVRELRPEAVSLALGEVIPDEDASSEVAAFLAWLKHERIAPQYILYAPDEVVRLHDVRARGVIPQRRPFVLFVLGLRQAEAEQPAVARVTKSPKRHATCCPFSPSTTRPVHGRRARSDAAKPPAY